MTSSNGISRRDLIRTGGVLGGLMALPDVAHAAVQAAASAPGALRAGPEVYASIGVRPLINGRGTFTIISGSTMLPEVRAAMDAAAQHYVHLDELTEAVGARLATLTGAEWGMVSNGCSAALTLAAAACVAGGNPDLHVRLPNLTGFAKDEAVIPTHSRNVYDAALRSVGLRVVEASTLQEFAAALGPRVAMIYILAGPNADNSPLNVKAIAPIAKARGIPILVDAAAEILTVPNVHLQNGATLVAYSGGKCLRGPQTAGLLLGRKDLVKAAWVHSAPHHGVTRALKVGKEDAIGMLMAVEMWVKRDHDAEWKRWNGWLDHIAQRVATIAGVTTTVAQPNGLSNRTPSLRIVWERQKLGISGEAVVKLLFDGAPRITVDPARGGQPAQTGVAVTPYMMAAGDEKVIADRLVAILSKPPAQPQVSAPSAPAGEIAGQWAITIQYAAATSNHTLHLTQKGNDLGGFHQGEFMTREVTGTIDGDAVRIRSAFGEQHGDSINLTFVGKLTGDQMSGTLDMGEYLGATWTGARRGARRG
ncbi:MAG: aminotransferase class V-fold PLP-dependent enzyme [Vicinamibacterales bacterium]